MKKLSIIALIILMPFLVWSQDSAGQEDVIRRVVEASAAVESFSCDFTQVREVALLSTPDVSKGSMQYRNDGRVLWHYTSPIDYQIVFTRDAMLITKEGRTQSMSLSENPFMGQLREILLGIMDGRQLASNDRFQVSVISSTPDITVGLVPVQRQMKKMFRDIELTFTGRDCLVSEVILHESDGSSTTITFSNRKLNQEPVLK